MTRRILSALLAALLIGLLAPPAHAADSMKMKQARQVFSKQMCRLASSDERLNAAVFRGRDTVHVSDITPEWLASINRALKKAAQREHDIAGKLYLPPADWPDVAEREVLESALYVSTDTYAMLSTRGDTAQQFVKRWNGLLIPFSKKVGKRIRVAMLMLGLDDIHCGGNAKTTLRRLDE